MTNEKECFFIAPIGEEGSKIRERSDKVLEYIVEEAMSDFDYSVTRADQMDEPGSITNQVIQKTVNSELVVADLSGHNPNVFYELAVRHATGKPYIQLIEQEESIPFDIADVRTINYGLGVEEADIAKKDIIAQLESLETDNPEFDNPISRSAEMESLKSSKDPAEQGLGEILESVSRLEGKINRLDQRVKEKESKQTSLKHALGFEKEDIRKDDEIIGSIGGEKISEEDLEGVSSIQFKGKVPDDSEQVGE